MAKLNIKLNNIKLAVFLAQNELTQRQLAEKLDLSEHTITGYKRKKSFPLVFQYALAGLEIELKKEAE